MRPWILAASAMAISTAGQVTLAQTYHLRLHSASWMELCEEPCVCPYVPLRGTIQGTFDLIYVDRVGDAELYLIDNINWVFEGGETLKRFTGSGVYNVRYAAATGGTGTQFAQFDLESHTGVVRTLTSGFVPVSGHPQHMSLTASLARVGCNNAAASIIAIPACPGDVDDGTGTGTPDGSIDVVDLVYFLGAWNDGNTRADVDNGSGTGMPDGAADLNDLLYFLSRFQGGC